MKEGQINFRFAKNWREFNRWYDSTKVKGRPSLSTASWEDQQKMIQNLFETTIPDIVNWKILWKDFFSWYNDVLLKKDIVEWSEQKRQIETLMLNQLKDLNEHNFVLAYLDKGIPTIDSEKFSYWEALKVKKELEGDANGNGGNENLDRITILNLKQILR